MYVSRACAFLGHGGSPQSPCGAPQALGLIDVRTSTIEAATDCNLYGLRRDAIVQSFSAFPSQLEAIKKEAHLKCAVSHAEVIHIHTRVRTRLCIDVFAHFWGCHPTRSHLRTLPLFSLSIVLPRYAIVLKKAKVQGFMDHVTWSKAKGEKEASP